MRRLVIGVGNPDRGDDGAGREVARRLAAREDCPREVRASSGEAGSLMSAWSGFEDVVLVDACAAAGSPGRVRCVLPHQLDRVAGLRHASTHSLGVAGALGLARALDALPSRLVIYAIEGGCFELGTGLSPDVERAVDRVVALVARDAAPHR